MTDVDECLELVYLALKCLPGEVGLTLRVEEGVYEAEVAVEFGAGYRVAHLGGEDICAVVTHAGVALELDHGERLERVDAEVQEVLELEEDVQERSPPGGPTVGAVGVCGVVGPDVELVNDEVAEVRRPKTLVMPGVGVRVPDDAVAVGPGGVKPQLPGVGVALQALATRAHDEKSVGIPVFHAGHKAAPDAAGVFREERPWSWMKQRAGRVELQVDLGSGGRPDAKRCTARDQVCAKRAVPINVVLRDPGHGRLLRGRTERIPS